MEINYKHRDLFRHNPEKLRAENPEIFEALQQEHEKNKPTLRELKEIAEGLNTRPGEYGGFDPRD